MKNSLVLLILSFGVLLSCKEKIQTDTLRVQADNLTETDNLKVLDTTIVLNNINKDLISQRLITESEAQKALYKHFTSKGFINQDELKGGMSDNGETICFNYDTIYNLGIDGHSVGIISYWLMPAYASGTCFQPNRALIENTKNGFRITHEEFISPSFLIDSIGKNAIVYGNEYDCAEHQTIRNYQLHLKVK